jgi:DNA-binding transcriptional LysR family regulator
MYNSCIKTFIEVVKCKSFSSASEKLYISKVSIMKQINAFEKHVGVKLLIRSNHGVALTEAGKEIYEAGNKIVNFSESTINKLRKTYNQELTVKIGTSLLYPANELIDLWRNVPDSNSNLKLNMVSMGDSYTNLISFLNQLGKSIDCFATLYDENNFSENYSLYPLAEKACCISIPRSHKLAGKKRLKWSDLSGETLMLLKRGNSAVIDAIRNNIEKNYKNINIVDVPSFYNAEIFNRCVEKGFLLETPSIWNNVHPSLVSVPMSWNYKLKFGIVYLKNPNKAVQTFINEISQIKK